MAAEIVTETGADSLTMEGVATRAGVSKALGYRYFTNRHDLLLALFDREMAVLDERIGAAVDHAGSFEDGLRSIVRAWVDLIHERGVLLGSLQQSTRIEGPVEQRRADRQRRLDAFFADLITGAYDLPLDDAMLVAATLVSGSEGAMRIWLANGWSRDRIAERYVRLSLGAIEALAREPACRPSRPDDPAERNHRARPVVTPGIGDSSPGIRAGDRATMGG